MKNPIETPASSSEGRGLESQPRPSGQGENEEFYRGYARGLSKAVAILNTIPLSTEQGEREAWPAIMEAVKQIAAELKVGV